MTKTKLILLRHGQSEWNKLNFFTGWVDVPLSTQGIQEAVDAGKKIKDVPIHIIFTSTLVRSLMTAMIAMTEHGSKRVPVIVHDEDQKLEGWSKIHSPATKESVVPVIRAQELNERMYGELQGLNKAETAEKFGAEQVRIWRRSYDVPPPGGESLEMTAARSIPYFLKTIVPYLQEGSNAFVVAHGNSLRAIMMHLDGLSKDEVLHLELGTGSPMIYEYENEKFTKL